MKLSTLFTTAMLSAALFSTASWANNAADIEVKNPFAREVPPGAPASASFMMLKNNSGKAIKIISAESDIAKVVELHTHTNDNGVMRMRKIDFIEIPANGMTELKPGGLHIMLIGPKEPLKASQTIEVKLNYADGSSETVAMPVKSLMGMGMKMNHGHGNMGHMGH